jgi:hypothetical protein
MLNFRRHSTSFAFVGTAVFRVKKINIISFLLFFTEFYEKYTFGKKIEGIGVGIDNFLGATEEMKQSNLMKQYHLCCEGAHMMGRTKPDFIPITTSLMGDMVVLRADSPMQMVYWVGDVFEMPEGIEWGTTPGNPEARPALLPIAPDLETFYNSLTADPDRDW